MPLFNTHTRTPNQVNKFTRPSIIRARLPLRHHGAPTPVGAIPVTPFRNALLTNLLLRASPAAVSSARLAANQRFSPLAPTTSASRCFQTERIVQYSTKRRLLSAGSAGKHEGKRGSRAGTLVRRGRGEGHQGAARARNGLACRVVSETMPLAFGSVGASAHRHRCE
ncbi:hypothetical protein T492DRAFT_994765 [Pavlovales sp. CCMP2436]|nr:hypothetical protein T492DRAFT_994765 [Pavlovales sp. CCMP2436]